MKQVDFFYWYIWYIDRRIVRQENLWIVLFFFVFDIR